MLRFEVRYLVNAVKSDIVALLIRCIWLDTWITREGEFRTNSGASKTVRRKGDRKFTWNKVSKPSTVSGEEIVSEFIPALLTNTLRQMSRASKELAQQRTDANDDKSSSTNSKVPTDEHRLVLACGRRLRGLEILAIESANSGDSVVILCDKE